MKFIKSVFVFAIVFTFLSVNAQEKKIKFSIGTLKICSSKNFQIEGYDGDEVIIKSLHEKRDSNISYVVNGYSTPASTSVSSSQSSSRKTNGFKNINGKNNEKKDKWIIEPKVNVVGFTSSNKNDSIKGNSFVFFNNNDNRKKGLKKIGKKSQNADLGIYFTIEQNGDQLLFKDQSQVGFVMTRNESYVIKIPNALKLNWQTNNCKEQDRTGQYRFFGGKTPSSLTNFNGEVEIASTLNNIKLVDVTGPVVINTIGGNVIVEFDQKYPKEIYSIYTNNGFIDIQIPKQSNILIDVIGKNIYSDVDFNVLEEEEVDDVWQKTNKMKLKYGSGKVKMKLNGGFGNVYLRKK